MSDKVKNVTFYVTLMLGLLFLMFVSMNVTNTIINDFESETIVRGLTIFAVITLVLNFIFYMKDEENISEHFALTLFVIYSLMFMFTIMLFDNAQIISFTKGSIMLMNLTIFIVFVEIIYMFRKLIKNE